MKGKVHVVVQNRRVRFEFDLRRNITIVRGDSATGKTTLISMIETYSNIGEESGIVLHCDKSCVVINNANWKAVLKETKDSIVFADEELTVAKTIEFARYIRTTDNYYVFITRESLPNLPYSVEEVYGIHTSGKYAGLRQTYNSFYRLYPIDSTMKGRRANRVIVEDSNSGYEFYKAIAADEILVETANGKANIRNMCTQGDPNSILIIADGAAFGSEIGELYQYINRHPGIQLYLPESFEWVILSSGLVDGNKVKKILEKPADFIESSEYFCWEQYFTKLLVQETIDSYLQYSKHKLNRNYLNMKERMAIVQVIRIIWNELGIPETQDLHEDSFDRMDEANNQSTSALHDSSENMLK